MAERAAAATRSRTLFSNVALLQLWTGQLISQAGDAMFEIALLWTALELTDSAAAAGMIAAVTYLPALLFGMVGGALADRVDRRTLMLLSDGVRALAAAAIPALAHFGLLTVWSLGGLAFALAVFGALFSPARDALVPSLVPPEQRTAANSLLQSCWQLSLIIGPALAAALIPLVGLHPLFTVDALSFALSFALIASMRLPRQERSAPAQGLARGALSDVRQGLAYARGDARVAGMLVITALDNLFLMGPALIGLPLFVRDVMHGSPAVYAASAVPYALGMMLGTLALNTVAHRFRPGAVMLAGMVLDGATLLPFLWLHTPAQLWLVLAIHGLATPLIVVSRPTLVQNLVPPELQGRVFGMIGTAVIGFTALSSAATGVLAAHLPIRTLFAVIAVGASACGVVGLLFKPLRQAG